MAFDAGFLAAVASELRRVAIGARVEKAYQPEKDTVILQMRTFAGGKRLLINAGSSNPRIGFSEITMENPQNPPLFCVLLRKHLSGAKLVAVEQAGFERVLTLTFETRDEMGFPCKRRLIAEIMGKYSNLIFCDEGGKVLCVLRPVDFSTSSRRQVLPGMTYELPPAQDKVDPLVLGETEFAEIFAGGGDASVEKWITSRFLGISAAVAREIAFRACGRLDARLCDISAERLWNVFSSVIEDIRAERFCPSFALDGQGNPVEYAFFRLSHYESVREIESPCELLDVWFSARDKQARVKQRAHDILRLLSNARARVSHKLELQRGELADCEKGLYYKKMGDLIVANCYLLKKGMERATLTDYEDLRPDGSFGTVEVELDARLQPGANAQRYFKKYTKSRNAKTELAKQIALGEAELAYLNSVSVALDSAESPTDLAEIREELARFGYAARLKKQMGSRKLSTPAYAEYRTSGGYRVLCGKNNLQNEYITHKLAEKTDYWFHAKNMPGSHVVMLLEGKGEPDAEDFTEAASIAALFCEAAGAPMTEVDYTLVRHLKKTPGAKPGFVIYHTNWSAVVTPDKEKIAAMRQK